jgi:hypothetical protein
MTYVQNIIKQFGGLRAMSRAVRIPASTISGWASRGSIPDTRKAHVLVCALSAGINLEPADFFPLSAQDQASGKTSQ